MLAALAWINQVKFGSPWLTGYHQWRAADPAWRQAHSDKMKARQLNPTPDMIKGQAENVARLKETLTGKPHPNAAIKAKQREERLANCRYVLQPLVEAGLSLTEIFEKSRAVLGFNHVSSVYRAIDACGLAVKKPVPKDVATGTNKYARSYQKRREVILAKLQAGRDAERRAKLGLAADAPVPEKRITHLTTFDAEQLKLHKSLRERINYLLRQYPDFKAQAEEQRALALTAITAMDLTAFKAVIKSISSLGHDQMMKDRLVELAKPPGDSPLKCFNVIAESAERDPSQPHAFICLVYDDPDIKTFTQTELWMAGEKYCYPGTDPIEGFGLALQKARKAFESGGLAYIAFSSSVFDFLTDSGDAYEFIESSVGDISGMRHVDKSNLK